jgi:hypothetical protein
MVLWAPFKHMEPGVSHNSSSVYYTASNPHFTVAMAYEWTIRGLSSTL